MGSNRKSADLRQRDLELAISRISKKRSHTGETKISFSSVAREAGVSTALIHNHYPSISEKIRELQGKEARIVKHKKHQELKIEKDKNKALRCEINELRAKIASLASINEMLINENQIHLTKLTIPHIVDIDRKR